MLRTAAGRTVLVLDHFLRSIVTAVLALGITGGASYEVIAQGKFESPLVNWGGIIIGVYFGSVVATRGEIRRRSTDPDAGSDNGAP